MIKETKIIVCDHLDPWHNLALEEYLMQNRAPEACIFYLWQNDKTVVIGKNQNPWRECKVKELEAEGGKLARRLSGGGAVYHGKGNLNFTFIMPKDDYDVDRQLKVIQNAVNKLGIKAEKSGRNDMTVDGKKFSGNAFLIKKSSAMHHGTLLIAEDLQELGRYLQVSKEKIASKGVKSVQSRVGNLKSINPVITVEDVKEKLIKAFTEEYGGSGEVVNADDLAREEYQSLIERNASWDWRYGRDMKFDASFEKRFDWGEVQIHLNLKDGHVEKSTVYSDALDVDFIAALGSAFEGKQYNSTVFGEGISALIKEAYNESHCNDLIAWMVEKNF